MTKAFNSGANSALGSDRSASSRQTYKLVTLRESITAKKRRSAILVSSGVALFAGGGAIAAGMQQPWLVCISLAGFALATVGMLYQFYGIRCARCRAVIDATLHTNPFGVPRGYSFCPYCGVSLDCDIDGTQRSNHALQPTTGRSDN